MPIAECGALLSRNADVTTSCPQRNFRIPVYAGIHRTIAARALPTRSDMTLRRGARLKPAALELLADELTGLVNPQKLDEKTASNHHELYECLKPAESVVLELRQVSLRPIGLFVGDVGDVRISPDCVWGYRSHQADKHQPGREFHLVIGSLGDEPVGDSCTRRSLVQAH